MAQGSWERLISYSSTAKAAAALPVPADAPACRPSQALSACRSRSLKPAARISCSPQCWPSLWCTSSSAASRPRRALPPSSAPRRPSRLPPAGCGCACRCCCCPAALLPQSCAWVSRGSRQPPLPNEMLCTELDAASTEGACLLPLAAACRPCSCSSVPSCAATAADMDSIRWMATGDDLVGVASCRREGRRDTARAQVS